MSELRLSDIVQAVHYIHTQKNTQQEHSYKPQAGWKQDYTF
jgi:hypothetical protein